jgi:dihydroorotate dehydrogenase
MIFAVDLIPSAFTGTIVNQWQRTLFRAEIGECNIYTFPPIPTWRPPTLRRIILTILQAVKSTVKIPVARKLSPFFNMADMAHRLDTDPCAFEPA